LPHRECWTQQFSRKFSKFRKLKEQKSNLLLARHALNLCAKISAAELCKAGVRVKISFLFLL
jgi:hypothetical protein